MKGKAKKVFKGPKGSNAHTDPLSGIPARSELPEKILGAPFPEGSPLTALYQALEQLLELARDGDPSVGIFRVETDPNEPREVDKAAADAKWVPIVQAVRKPLSASNSPPIDEVVALGGVPILAALVDADFTPSICFEALWALTNVASGTSHHTSEVHRSGVLVKAVELLTGPFPDLVEQSVWLLSNTAGDSPQYRDYCLSLDVVPKFCHLCENVEMPISVRNQAMWALSNLCRGKPRPDFTKIVPMLPTLTRIIECAVRHEGNVSLQMLQEGLWAVSYMSDGPNNVIDTVVKSGVVVPTMELLRGHRPPPPAPFTFSPERPLERPHEHRQQFANGLPHDAFRDILRFVPGKAMQLDFEKYLFLCKDIFFDVVCVEEDLYGRARNPYIEDANLQIPALRACGNIVTGTDEQTQYMLDHGIVGYLGQLMKAEKRALRKEACWSLSNITAGTPSQIQVVLDAEGVIATTLQKAMPEGDVFEVRKEALWVIGNAFSGGTREQFRRLLKEGALVPIFVATAAESDRKLREIASQCFESISEGCGQPASEAIRKNLRQKYERAMAPTASLPTPTIEDYLARQAKNVHWSPHEWFAEVALPWLASVNGRHELESDSFGEMLSAIVSTYCSEEEMFEGIDSRATDVTLTPLDPSANNASTWWP